ncbi:enoyl-CoA hydratase/isomerase family protein [Nocardioides sp. AE5]|uniref:enoyl-CoA hydratase/isomerase family protein n=1 Tax=Nocardioides sp. AE5 TaxID=2962573 RepID=UPI002881A0F7|nr:enoyl-CoA hydratase/isomerase family protein [Nocardioides sp. AE5]MDT0200671.1 enoyl-CoA hydratase/isomerase family protein [Nocardioides sp. AE5]
MSNETPENHAVPVVSADARGSVGIVTMRRPDRLNALTGESMDQLRDSLVDLGRSDDIGVIVLRGEGRAFCAGLDLKDGRVNPLAADPVEEFHDMLVAGVEVIWAIRSVPQPVIAVIQGHAVGAGFALAAAADLRMIAADARFSAPFLNLGMTVGDLGLSWFLPRLIGHGRATRTFLDAGTIDAETAVKWGLAQEVSADPFGDALDMAHRLCGLPRYGVRSSKTLINASAGASLRDHLDSEARAQVIGALTKNAVQAMDRASQRSKEKK